MMMQFSSYNSFSVNDSNLAAEIILSKVPDTLSGTAKLIYQALVLTAIETAKGRGYSPNVTHVTLHLPSEQLAIAIGVDRVTVWRHLPALKELGLVDYRTHKGTCRGKTRNTGTLFQVRLDPSRGSACRLSYDDMKHKWRDLDSDCKRGRRSYDSLQHTKEPNNTGIDLERLLEWTLKPSNYENPVTSVCCKPRRVDLEAVLDVKNAPKEDRNKMVALAAEALATALNDKNSVSWYQKLLWALLRRYQVTGDDYSYQVYLMATRAAVDAVEGFARKPGALFHSRLKKADWFDWVMNAPPTRVGTKPN